MDRIRIKGGKKLHGSIPISGAKNAALPIMAAALLSDKPLTLTNMPHLADVSTMANLLAALGVDITMDGAPAADGHLGRVLHLTGKDLSSTRADYELVRKMRASVLVLGPLVARAGQASVSLPGGCAIGTRPIDLHLKALEALGAEIDLQDGYVEARAPKGLVGATFQFPFVSVGATENALMAATLAKGRTVLLNAAREPEIGDLAKCLNAMGAKITGIGTDTLTIDGVDNLQPARHAILPDRIETGTYAMAVGLAGGDVELKGARLADIQAAADILRETGVLVEPTADGIHIARNGIVPQSTDLTTAPFPGFPTDLQAQAMTFMTMAEGAASITETIFENRFMHVPELCRLGADIEIQGATAVVRGVKELKGAPVMATDLRASVSLILAGLAAEGETIVSRVYHLDRGYERLEEKLRACGADIERLRD